MSARLAMPAGGFPVPDAAGTRRARGGLGWGRFAAGGALGALLLHLVVAAGHGHDPLMALVVALMGAGCAVCAIQCFRAPCLRALTTLLIMSAAMVTVHVVWLMLAGSLAGAGAGDHHAHAATLAAGADHASSSMALSMLGLALAELVVAGLCAVAIRRAPPTPF